MNSAIKSWRTTVAGWMAFIAAAAPQVTAMVDGDPDTIATWTLAVPLLFTAIALTFSRDSNVSSEEAGAK